MITREQIPSVLDHAVYGPDGSKIGDAKHIYLDDASGRPEWATVKTGMFGTRETFVPIGDATLVEDHLEVPYDKAKVKDAPTVEVDAGGHLSQEEEHRLYEYYGVDWDEAWDKAEHPGRDDTGEAAGAAGMAGAAGAAGAAGRAEAAEDTGGRTADTGTERTAMPGGTAEPGTREDLTGKPEGRTAHDTSADTAEAMRTGRTGTGEEGMIRSEEQLRVGVESEEVGRARLHKYVVTEEVEQVVPLRHEEVRVEREPITEADRGAAFSGPDIAEADHEVILHAERAVVETEAVPVERVRLTTEEHVEQETVRGRVRKEKIDLEMPDREATPPEGKGGMPQGKGRRGMS
ncbi:PRC and DUF2382 domain-containing protein [Streptomyces sp. NPDC058045]|uniref:PRC and DUF2382 domain-containing protein n=1 Tax=Streptomyces sp. NPDC058045 TaxID=3346311 RepID=UPI0036E86755